MRRVRGYDLVQRGVAGRFGGRGHEETAVHRRGDVLVAYIHERIAVSGTKTTHPERPWVDLQCLTHVLTDAHELAQDERRSFRAFLRNDKLHRGGVHPIAQRCDHAQIRNRKKRVEFVLFERLVANA